MDSSNELLGKEICISPGTDESSAGSSSRASNEPPNSFEIIMAVFFVHKVVTFGKVQGDIILAGKF